MRCAIGVHPNYTHDASVDDLPRLRDLHADPAVIALGEMGLDYHHQFSSRERQMAFFEPQLQLAADVNKPVVIHSREATDDTLAVMRGFPAVRAVFHCFTGTAAERGRSSTRGTSSASPAPTFKKSDPIREAAALTPLDRMFVETDAPYLTPEPMRKQKTNEPALVVHVAEALGAHEGRERRGTRPRDDRKREGILRVEVRPTGNAPHNPVARSSFDQCQSGSANAWDGFSGVATSGGHGATCDV